MTPARVILATYPSATTMTDRTSIACTRVVREGTGQRLAARRILAEESPRARPGRCVETAAPRQDGPVLGDVRIRDSGGRGEGTAGHGLRAGPLDSHAIITAIVAPPGVGKTRIVAEWCKRLGPVDQAHAHATSMAHPVRRDTKTLWLCYDRNWRGLVRSFTQFGAPGIGDPADAPRQAALVPDFDKPETMDILREFIKVHRPGWVVIDTTTYASTFNTGKPNEAKIAYDPIMDVLMETGCPGLGLTHTNNEGGVLNKRFLERCRVRIDITRPDPACKERLRLEVTKSDDKYPPALGATFTDTAVIYDTKPPEAPEAPKRGRKPTTSPGLAEFLCGNTCKPAPAYMVDIVKAARDKGLLKSPTDQEEPKPSISPLYDARDWVARQHPGRASTIRDLEPEGEDGSRRGGHREASTQPRRQPETTGGCNDATTPISAPTGELVSEIEISPTYHLYPKFRTC